MKIIEKTILQYEKPALLIGNGLNLYAGIMPSWKQLVNEAAGLPLGQNLDGLLNTEVYDLAAIEYGDERALKKLVANKLALSPGTHLSMHRSMMEIAMQYDIPVLTTNFDATLERAVGAQRHYISSERFSRFYPWKTYHGFKTHESPLDGFGIWKIHGDTHYKDSIRMGLTDYMGSAEKARKLIHSGENRLFKGNKRPENWQGEQTWLHIWFHCPLIIVGFGFGIDEVFLRWLLIERRRFFKLHQLPMQVAYISASIPQDPVKNLLGQLGVEFIKAGSYAEIYGEVPRK